MQSDIYNYNVVMFFFFFLMDTHSILVASHAMFLVIYRLTDSLRLLGKDVTPKKRKKEEEWIFPPEIHLARESLLRESLWNLVYLEIPAVPFLPICSNHADTSVKMFLRSGFISGRYRSDSSQLRSARRAGRFPSRSPREILFRSRERIIHECRCRVRAILTSGQ